MQSIADTAAALARSTPNGFSSASLSPFGSSIVASSSQARIVTCGGRAK